MRFSRPRKRFLQSPLYHLTAFFGGVPQEAREGTRRLAPHEPKPTRPRQGCQRKSDFAAHMLKNRRVTLTLLCRVKSECREIQNEAGTRRKGPNQPTRPANRTSKSYSTRSPAVNQKKGRDAPAANLTKKPTRPTLLRIPSWHGSVLVACSGRA
jgi:hypothetical protein